MLKRLIGPRNRQIRVVVGLLLVALVSCVYFAPPIIANRIDPGVAVFSDGKPVTEVAPTLLEQIEQMAKDDHIALLDMCLDNARQQYRDYTCTFIKQERIRGRMLPKQIVDASFRREPFSVAMAWRQDDEDGGKLEMPKGDRALYIEGQFRNKMVIRPTSEFLQALVGGSVKRDPQDPEVMKNTLRPITSFGFENSLQNLLDVYRQADDAGDLAFSFIGYAEVNGRETIALSRMLPPERDYPAAETRIFIDLEYLVPVLVEGYDWDGEKFCYYLFQDVQFNLDLPAEAFTPEALDIDGA